MVRSVRWLVAVAATLVSFLAALWIARTFPLPFEPRGEADQWVVGAAFAAAVSAAVLAAAGFWAGREAPEKRDPAPAVRSEPERADASEPVLPASGDHFDIHHNTFRRPAAFGSGPQVNIDRPGGDGNAGQ